MMNMRCALLAMAFLVWAGVVPALAQANDFTLTVAPGVTEQPAITLPPQSNYHGTITVRVPPLVLLEPIVPEEKVITVNLVVPCPNGERLFIGPIVVTCCDARHLAANRPGKSARDSHG